METFIEKLEVFFTGYIVMVLKNKHICIKSKKGNIEKENIVQRKLKKPKNAMEG